MCSCPCSSCINNQHDFCNLYKHSLKKQDIIKYENIEKEVKNGNDRATDDKSNESNKQTSR